MPTAAGFRVSVARLPPTFFDDAGRPLVETTPACPARFVPVAARLAAFLVVPGELFEADLAAEECAEAAAVAGFRAVVFFPEVFFAAPFFAAGFLELACFDVAFFAVTLAAGVPAVAFFGPAFVFGLDLAFGAAEAVFPFALTFVFEPVFVFGPDLTFGAAEAVFPFALTFVFEPVAPFATDVAFLVPEAFFAADRPALVRALPGFVTFAIVNSFATLSHSCVLHDRSESSRNPSEA